MIDLTEQERKVLTAWEDCEADFDVLNFNDIAHGSQMAREDAASATRSLAAKGLTSFRRGTFTEEGVPYGSGYGLTDAGRIAMREAETARDDAAIRALIQSAPHDEEGTSDA